METETDRKSGMGEKLNHRVKQKPSQEETGSESDVGVGSGLSPGSALARPTWKFLWPLMAGWAQP